MPTPATRRLTPEEEELDRKKAELTSLEAELAEGELELATLRAELAAFEREYVRVVGRRYAELDEAQAELAARKARQRPQDVEARQAAAEAQERAGESAKVLHDIEKEEVPHPFKPSTKLKSLYREAAKMLHPDLTTDPEERIRRTRYMAEVNRAYQAGDEKLLEKLLREWESSPEAVKGEGPGAELVRTIRRIAQAQGRLSVIREELARAKASALHQIKVKVDRAEGDGRDLLEEIAAGIAEQTQRLRLQLNRAQAGQTV